MGKYEAGKKSSCEGCGAELHPVYMTVHRLECGQYRSWSASLPHHCRKGCGMGFDAPRSRANHERVCAGVAAPVLTTCRLCGDRYAETLTAHLNDCKGPTVIPELADNVPMPEPDGCVCGYRGASVPAASAHRIQCSHWWVYSKRLSHGCEGCDRRFVDSFSKRTHVRACPAWLRWREQQAVVESEILTRSCPSCGKKVRGPQLGVHVKTCPGSFSREDWRQYYAAACVVRAKLRRSSRYENGAVSRQDYVECKVCNERFGNLSFHLASVHNMTTKSYREQYRAPTSAILMRLRSHATCRVKYGADHPNQVPAIKIARGLKRVRTMMERTTGRNSCITLYFKESNVKTFTKPVIKTEAKIPTPAEFDRVVAQHLPEKVVEIFTGLLVKHVHNGYGKIPWREFDAALKSEFGSNYPDYYDNAVVAAFRSAGWKIYLDEPGYNETYPAFYEVSRF